MIYVHPNIIYDPQNVYAMVNNKDGFWIGFALRLMLYWLLQGICLHPIEISFICDMTETKFVGQLVHNAKWETVLLTKGSREKQSFLVARLELSLKIAENGFWYNIFWTKRALIYAKFCKKPSKKTTAVPTDKIFNRIVK